MLWAVVRSAVTKWARAGHILWQKRLRENPEQEMKATYTDVINRTVYRILDINELKVTADGAVMAEDLSGEERKFLQQAIGDLIECVFRVRNVLRMEMFTQLLYLAAATVLQERLQQHEQCERHAEEAGHGFSIEKLLGQEHQEVPKKTLEQAFQDAQEDFNRAAEACVHDTISLEEFHSAMLQVEWRIMTGKLELPADQEHMQTAPGESLEQDDSGKVTDVNSEISEIAEPDRTLMDSDDMKPAASLDGVAASAPAEEPGVALPCSSPRSTSSWGKSNIQQDETEPSNGRGSKGIEAHSTTPLSREPPLKSQQQPLHEAPQGRMQLQVVTPCATTVLLT